MDIMDTNLILKDLVSCIGTTRLMPDIAKVGSCICEVLGICVGGDAQLSSNFQYP